MGKTKEITCWAVKNKNRNLSKDHIVVAFESEDLFEIVEIDDEVFKAKLIIELPEKKITITEREFDIAVRSVRHNSSLVERYSITDKLKRELGFNND